MALALVSEGCQWSGIRQILDGGIVMRIASGEVGAGAEEVKTNVAVSGSGSVIVVRLVVLVRCMVTRLRGGETRFRPSSGLGVEVQPKV